MGKNEQNQFELLNKVNDLVDAVNEELDLVKDLSGEVPKLNDRFSELENRIKILEKKVGDIMLNQSASEQDLIKKICEHIQRNSAKLEQLSQTSMNALRAESERTQKEAANAVTDMQRSLDDIVNTLADTLKPFRESLSSLQMVDSATTKTIEKISAMVDAVVKASEPHADLAKDTARLINESVSNMKSISAAFSQIIVTELRDKVDEAIKEMKASIKKNNAAGV